jgi:hypothetical protein
MRVVTFRLSKRVPRHFKWNQLMAKARNPKPEIRKKSEGRTPKGSSPTARGAASDRRTHASSPLGGRPVLRSTPTEIVVRSTAQGGPVRISDFGLLSDFGFRPSDFPRATVPLKTSEEPQNVIDN